VNSDVAGPSMARLRPVKLAVPIFRIVNVRFVEPELMTTIPLADVAFVMVSASPAAMSTPMTVVLNWQSALKR